MAARGLVQLAAQLLRRWLPVLGGCAAGAAAGFALHALAAPGVGGWVVSALAVFGAVLGNALAARPGSGPVTHGSARFRGREELGPFRDPAGLWVGRAAAPDNFPLHYSGPGHLLTVAPTRAGKGAGSIIPNLLTADRPAVVIDPKGENFHVTARARGAFGPVWPLDPFQLTGPEGAAYNPLDFLDPAGERFGEDAAALADAIVADPPGQVRDAHWNEEASALIAGLILLCATSEPAGRRNLARVRTYLTLAPEAFGELLEAMSRSEAAGGLVARAANRRLGQNEREAASVLSTAQRHTHFLDSERIAEATSRTDFTFSELVRSNGTAFLVLPPDRIPTHARWLRILLGQAIGELLREPAPPPKPVLFLLDECAALGRMRPLERAVGLMAGYGMQLWTVFQDLHQLRAIYGAFASTFVANAGIVQAFNVNDLETAQWLSATLGSSTATYEAGHAGNQARTARPLLTPDEVLNLPDDALLLLTQEGRPLLARKLRYYADAEFAGLFDPAAVAGPADGRVLSTP